MKVFIILLLIATAALLGFGERSAGCVSVGFFAVCGDGK